MNTQQRVLTVPLGTKLDHAVHAAMKCSQEFKTPVTFEFNDMLITVEEKK